MIVAAAFLLGSGAMGAAKPPPLPPPVVMTPDQERAFLAKLPRLDVEGKAFRVFGIRAVGPRPVLDSAAAKLVGEGWECTVGRDIRGELQLAVFAENKTLADVQKLARRFTAQEFGAIEATPMLFAEAGGP